MITSSKAPRTKGKRVPIDPQGPPEFSNKRAYIIKRNALGEPIYTKKYTEEQKIFIVTGIGKMMSPLEIYDAFKEHYGIEMEYYAGAINNYKKSAKWQPLINKVRDEYLKSIEEIPGFHKKVRMRRHEKVFDLALKKGDMKNAIQATEHQRREIEGDSSTLNLSLYNNKFNIFTDEELSQKHLEALEKVKRLSEKRGAPNEPTTQTITIGPEGIKDAG